eukprot:493313-Amphidinium_carterae.1
MTSHASVAGHARCSTPQLSSQRTALSVGAESSPVQPGEQLGSTRPPPRACVRVVLPPHSVVHLGTQVACRAQGGVQAAVARGAVVAPLC